jgi:putative hemolysin
MLANPFEKKVKILSTEKIKIKKSVKTITPQRNVDLLRKEVAALREQNGKLLESKNYEVFFCNAKDIPNMLHEIGRLREITFRDVGEGTNKAIDLDVYDSYYHHLFLWDHVANCLVGAYRMGLGKEIFKKYGINGFYVQTLFRIEPELHKMMENTIEMGRAFIIKEYQQRPLPLFLLWKGIVHVTLRHPEYSYLMGGVSISNQFSDFSKSLMIEFMKSHYYDPYIAQYIHPKKEYKVKLKDTDKDFVFDATKADMQKFDKIIDELEPGVLRIPVLLKKYVKQNARLVAFNVDPKFNDAVDGLMYIKVADIPESTVKPVMEEFQAELEKKAAELQNK